MRSSGSSSSSSGGVEHNSNHSTNNHQSNSNHSDDFSSVSDSFNFQPTLKLSDTLKLPTIPKCFSDSNLRVRQESVGSGKSILKSKSETQLTSILKESSSRESEEDRYLSGGYSEVVEGEESGSSTRIRPELKYTKSESQNGTYGFDSCRYLSGSESYSYSPGRLTRSKSVSGESFGESSTTSTTFYTRSIDHFTLNVVEGGQEGDGSRKRSSQSLADTLKFPKEYKYDHLTLRGDQLGEYDDSSCDKTSTFTNSVQQYDTHSESTTNRNVSRTSSTSSTSSSNSSEELIFRPRQSNVRAEPLRPNSALRRIPRSSYQPPAESRKSHSSSESYASRATGPRPSAVSRSLTAAAAAASGNPNHYTLSSQARFDGVKSVPTNKKPIKEQPSTHSLISDDSEDSTEAEDHFNVPLSPQYTPKRSLTHEDSHMTQQSSHVTQPHQHSGPCHVTSPDPPKRDLQASVSHVVPQVPVQQQHQRQQQQQQQQHQEAGPPPSSRDQSSLAQYQNSKSRAVANLRNRQLLQARGIRVLPPSPLRWLLHVGSDDETNGTDSVISRDAETHSPDLSIVSQTVVAQQPRRASLFRSYSVQKLTNTIETRDQVVKSSAESSMFKSRDLLEKLKFRKPTTFSLAKCVVDEILLFPARYLLIKREKLRKYALVHSAVTNCYILNTGWSRDEKTRVFSKAEGPFILKSNRRR